MTEATPWAVAVPLAGAALTFLLGRRGAGAIAILTGTGTIAAVAALTYTVWNGGPRRYAVGGWGAPVGIELYADGLSMMLLLASGGVALGVGAYALGYFPHRAGAGEWTPDEGFWPLLLFLWAALNALFLSADVFNLYVALELMTLAAVAQVVLAEERAALTAGIRYLLAALLGSLCYLLGVSLLYASLHTLDIALLGERMHVSAATVSAAALISVGLAVKAALFPFHFWLPRAHSIAPAPVSALLSALVVTAAWYVLARLWFEVFPGVLTSVAAQMVAALGAVAIVWGSLQAIRQQRLKIMIAYSTVAQIGYLFLVFPLAEPSPGGSAGTGAPWADSAWNGAMYHAISHAFAKAAMFLAAGGIVRAVGDDRIAGIRGIASHLPVTTYAFGLAGMTLVGLPPTGGFVAKWLLLSAAIRSGQWWWIAVILTGGVLTAGYVFQVLTQELSRAESDVRPRFAAVPWQMQAAAMAMAVASLLLGLRATEPLALLEIGSPFTASGPEAP